MKKSIFLFILAAMVIFGVQSCKKTESPPKTIQTVTTNINAKLQKNQSYQFTLPCGTTIINGKQQAYNITTPASHSSISFVSVNASGNNVYEYTPTLNYTGSDFVTISNATSQTCVEGGGCNMNGGNNGCCHHGDGKCDKANSLQQNIVNINFTISNETNLNPVLEKIKTITTN